MRKKILVLMLALVLTMASANMIPSVDAAVVEPGLVIKGILTKDVTDVSDIFGYEDDDGENQTLSYTVDGNVTLDTWNYYIADAFANASTQGTETAGIWTVSKDLITDNGMQSFLFRLVNSSPVVVSTWYQYLFVDSVNQEVDEDDYVLLSAQFDATAGDPSTTQQRLIYVFEDTWLNTYKINVYFEDAEEFISTTSTQITICLNRSRTTAYQAKIADILDLAGKSWDLQKLVEVHYSVSIVDTSVESSYDLNFRYRHAMIAPTVVKVANQVLNSTQVETSYGNFITTPFVKIKDVQIPFKFTAAPVRYFNADELTIKYSYEFSIPSDASLSFSNTIANMSRGSFEWTNFTKLYVDTALAPLSTYSGTHQTVIASVTAGLLHSIAATVEASSSVYDEILASAGLVFWSVDTLWDWFWGGLAFIASILGFGVVYTKAQQRRHRTARANAA